MEKADILNLIQGLAPHHDLPWELVAAVVMTESSFNPWAIRYEPDFKYIVGIPTPTEKAAQMTSWGLMQVMGAVAREHGFKGPYLSELCEPTIGLTYGMLHLAKFRRRYPVWKDAIAAYNAGHPQTLNGKYLNQGYVEKVVNRWGLFERPIPIKETEL